jgi:hypothetical protein
MIMSDLRRRLLEDKYDPRHGTTTVYSYGCRRRDLCRAANAADQRRRRRKAVIERQRGSSPMALYVAHRGNDAG